MDRSGMRFVVFSDSENIAGGKGDASRSGEFAQISIPAGCSAVHIAACAHRQYDRPMSFGETVFLFLLALLVFGPKKLPEIARQVGKVLNEFRKASNEFRSQIEAEISHIDAEHNIRKILPPSEPPGGAVAALNVRPDPVSTSEPKQLAPMPSSSEPKQLAPMPSSPEVLEGSVVESNRDPAQESRSTLNQD